jgi:hypothetical protein
MSSEGTGNGWRRFARFLAVGAAWLLVSLFAFWAFVALGLATESAYWRSHFPERQPLTDPGYDAMRLRSAACHPRHSPVRFYLANHLPLLRSGARHIHSHSSGGYFLSAHSGEQRTTESSFFVYSVAVLLNGWRGSPPFRGYICPRVFHYRRQFPQFLLWHV